MTTSDGVNHLNWMFPHVLGLVSIIQYAQNSWPLLQVILYSWSIAYFFSPVSSSFHSPICIIHQNIHGNSFIYKVIHKYKISHFTRLVQNFERQQPLSCFLFSECLIYLMHIVRNSTLSIIAAFASIDKKELIQYSLHFSSLCCFGTKAAVCEPT